MIINQINETTVEVGIISAGGWEGIFPFGWGVEKSRNKNVLNYIEQIGKEYKQQIERL